ncbi:molecular chaperone, partial [Enterobacter hormaechei]|nr:molecular chaperone [Enterobacter hormaechei]
MIMRFYLIIDRASSEIVGFRALTKFSNRLQIAWFKEFIVKKLLCAASFGIALAFSVGAQAA